MYVITEASGGVGLRVAEQLASQKKPVRLVISEGRPYRAPGTPAGVEVRVGDFGDVAFLTAAFAGATAVYTGRAPSLVALDPRGLSASTGANVVRALQDAGVAHVVNLSQIGADLPELAVLHEQEQRLNALPKAHVLHVRQGYLMEYLRRMFFHTADAWCLGGPIAGDVALPLVTAKDVQHVVVAALTKLDFTGVAVRGALGPRDVTLNEVATAIGEAIGADELPYVQVPPDAAARDLARAEPNMSAPSILDALAFYAAVNAGRATAGTPRDAAGTTPTTLGEYMPQIVAVFEALQVTTP